MAAEDLSAAVMGFLRDHIQSVAQLEILALVQTSPDREWTAREIDAALSSNEKAVAHWLAHFARDGLLAEESRGKDPVYRYQPRSEAQRSAAVECVQAFRTKPVLVIETIFKQDRLAQSFANAFRIRPR